jgi:hypothetical protein
VVERREGLHRNYPSIDAVGMGQDPALLSKWCLREGSEGRQGDACRNDAPRVIHVASSPLHVKCYGWLGD